MVLNNKMIVPIALGLSLVTVTAVVVYFVFKKDEEESEQTKSQVKTMRNHMIEVPVPKTCFSALIGRGGCNLKQVEKDSGASIQLKRLTDKDYDLCIIRGRVECAQLAETLVHEFVRNQPVIEEDSMIVPSWACGRIIGVGGTTINEISHQSGARLKIDSGDGPGRLVSVKGTAQQIAAARVLVDKCIAQEKCRREVEQAKRTARLTQNSASKTESPSDISGDVRNNTRQKHVTNSKSDAGGAAIEVYVSAVSSPGRFWVQFVGPQVAQLDELVEQMTDFYSNRDNRKNHQLTEVSVGQVVAAVFRHDGRWYRARVCDVRANEFDSTQKVADVFYLDYGDSEYVATHELCELRADLLRLRFQAMECFLAGVRPKGPVVDAQSGGVQRWDKWPPEAIERFEELTQVARWKPLISRTCSYKKFVTVDGDKEKEIPGIMLYDVTEDGEIDIGATLVSEGWAEETPPPPATHPPPTPFGDLGNSKVLGMLGDRGERSSSLPKDSLQGHMTVSTKPTSTSLASGLERTPNPLHLSYPAETQHQVNGSDSFLHTEREDHQTASSETLVPKLGKTELDELKANMNRIDSHHGNLETLGRHSEHNM